MPRLDFRSRVDLLSIALIALASALPVVWFAHNWMLLPDAPWYLLLARNLLSGEGYTVFGNVPTPLRGPTLPIILTVPIATFGGDIPAIAWTMRLLTLANPILLYFLMKRIASPAVGLVSACLVSYLGYLSLMPHAFTPDPMLLTMCLASLLTLFLAISRDRWWLWSMSGAFLAASVLTKETAFAAAPLAIVAALLYGSSLRGLVSYYAAFTTLLIPWWLWVWNRTGEIYLLTSGQVHALERVPLGALVAAVLAGTSIVLAGAAFVLYWLRSSWIPLLSRERARVRLAWLLTLGWSVSLTTVVLLRNDKKVEGNQTYEGMWEYLLEYVLPKTHLWYLLPLGLAFVVWKAAKGDKGWSLFLAHLLMWTPVWLLVLTLRYSIRQWMMPEALLYAALAGLLVEELRRVWSHQAPRALRAWWPRVAVAVLLVPIAVVTVDQTQNLLSAGRDPKTDPANRHNVAIRSASSWIEANVPAGERILMTATNKLQFVFLDRGRHEWPGTVTIGAVTREELLQQARCNGWGKAVRTESCRTSHIVWYQAFRGGCDAHAVSVEHLAEQMEATGAQYVLLTKTKLIPSMFVLTWGLAASGTFELVHSSVVIDSPDPRKDYGTAILRYTGREPRPVPASMGSGTFKRLKRCFDSSVGQASEAAIRAAFPYGIRIVGVGPKTTVARSQVQRIYSDTTP